MHLLPPHSLHLYIYVTHIFLMLVVSLLSFLFGCTLSSCVLTRSGRNILFIHLGLALLIPHSPPSSAAAGLPHTFATSSSSCTHTPCTPPLILHHSTLASHCTLFARNTVVVHMSFLPSLSFFHLMVLSSSAVFLLRIAQL